MNIEDYLEENGPALSSKIKKELIKEGLSDDASRKAISRLGGNIKRLSVVKFPKRENFLFLNSQYKTFNYFMSLLSAFKETNSIHYSLISTMISLGRKLTKEKIQIICGCPIAAKKKKNYSTVIEELEASGILETENGYFVLNDDVVGKIPAIVDDRIISYLNELLGELLLKWLKENSFVSYSAASRNSEFCGYFWDITAPSYLLPLIKQNTNKILPGFVVADILPQYDIGIDEIEYFIKKTLSSNRNGNNRPFIPILIGNSFLPEAFRLAKEKNILVTTPKNLFGDEIEALLKTIVKVLESSTTISNLNSPDNIKIILDAAAKIEGEGNNLRGHFFELIVGHIVSSFIAGPISIGKKIKTSIGQKAEIDVMVVTTNEIRVYECKGYNKNQVIKTDDIKKWRGKISIIYEWIREIESNSNRSVLFSFWTTSSFDLSSIEELNRMKVEIGKYKTEFKNGHEVLEISRKLNLSTIVQLLKDHFEK